MPKTHCSHACPLAMREGRALLFHELLDTGINAVRDVDLAFRAHGNHMRLAEFAQTFSWLAGGGEYLTVEIQFEDLSGEAVHHVNVLSTDIEAAWQTGELEF